MGGGGRPVGARGGGSMDEIRQIMGGERRVEAINATQMEICRPVGGDPTER